MKETNHCEELCAVRQDAHREMVRLLSNLHPEGRQIFRDAAASLSGVAVQSDHVWSLFEKRHTSPYEGIVPPVISSHTRFLPDSGDLWDALYNTALGVLAFGLEPVAIHLQMDDGVSVHIDKFKVRFADLFEEVRETEGQDREGLRSWERDEYSWWILWLNVAATLLVLQQGTVDIEANPRIGDPDVEHLLPTEIEVHPCSVTSPRSVRTVTHAIASAFRKIRGR